MQTKDAFWFTQSTKKQDPKEFFAQGTKETHLLLDELRKRSFDPRVKKVLETGCGIGRQTRGLADTIFGEVAAQLIYLKK